MIVVWNGEVFSPVSRQWAKVADREFVIGEQYRIEVRHERSMASHRHFHALVSEAWQTLPQHLAAEFPNPDALRKHCLIKAGFCDMVKIVCANDLEAILASNAMSRMMDGYRICTVSGNVVTVYTARSQSVKAMGKAEFQKSKEMVLSEIGKLIGADPTELGKAA